MLAKVSDFYDQEVDNSVKALTSMIEPCLIVVMGGMVGFIAISIMAPIFKLIGSYQLAITAVSDCDLTAVRLREERDMRDVEVSES